YQSVVALWPLPGPDADGGPPAAPVMASLRERIEAYMQKAAREAKRRTSWVDPDPDFERALAEFVHALLPDESQGSRFAVEGAALVGRIGRAGLWNGLARTLVHLTSPGVPDVYQGDELWNLTLVDPDNRRPVDFDRRRAMLAALEGVRA